MLIDPHVHSNEISRCSHLSVDALIDAKIKFGYDGAVLTNHTQPWYYEPQDHKINMQAHIDTFNIGRKYAEKRGFTLMLGIEVTISTPLYSDWLLYGVNEEFLLNSPCLYSLSQEELYAYCKENGVLMVQAHPYRMPIQPMNPKFMDGVEINCQPHDLLKKEEVIRFAFQNGLLLTCGVDFHDVDSDIKAGMVVPKGISTAVEFANYLKNGKSDIRIEGETFTYERKK